MSIETHDDRTLSLSPDVHVTIESARINFYLAVAGTEGLALGAQALEFGAAHARLRAAFEARAIDTDDWFSPDHGSEYFEKRGPALRLRDEYYYTPTPPELVEDDLNIVLRDVSADKQIAIPLDRVRLSLIGALFPLLRQQISSAQQQRILHPAAWRLLTSLHAAGFVQHQALATSPPRTAFSAHLIAHSTLLFESPTSRLLIDPMLSVRGRPEFSAYHNLNQPLSAVAITHPHWDHLHPDTLINIDRATPMLIPRRTHPASIVNVDIKHVLRSLGFSNIVELEPWEQYTAGDIELVATPYHGEGNGPEGAVNWMTYRVRLGGRSAFGAVDSCTDHVGTMDQVVREIHRRFGDTDILFSPVSANFQPITSWVQRPFFMGRGLFAFTGSAVDAVRWSTMLGAQHVVPYAVFALIPGGGCEAPHYQPASGGQSGTLDDLLRLLAAAPQGPVQVLEPGSALRWEQDGIPGYRPFAP